MFSEIISDYGLFTLKAENDICMWKVGNHYEYIVRYVDDIALESCNPDRIVEGYQKYIN